MAVQTSAQYYIITCPLPQCLLSQCFCPALTLFDLLRLFVSPPFTSSIPSTGLSICPEAVLIGYLRFVGGREFSYCPPAPSWFIILRKFKWMAPFYIQAINISTAVRKSHDSYLVFFLAPVEDLQYIPLSRFNGPSSCALLLKY